MLLFVAGAIPLDSLASDESLWPAGGLTFDFKAISDRRFDFSGVPTADDPHNLIPADDVAAPLPHGYEKWHEFRCINDDAVPPGSPYHQSLIEQVPMDRKDGVYHVVKAKALRDFCARNGVAEKYRTFEGTWRKYVRLPDAKGGSFRVSCRYRMSHDLPQTGYPITGCIIIHSWKIDPKTGDYVHCGYFPLTHFHDCDGWTGIAADFDVPEGPEIVSLQFRHDGIGEFFVKDMVLVRRACAEGEGVTISLIPGQAMDGSFAVSSGQCGQLTWGWRKNGPDAFDPSDSEFRLALPVGFEFVGDTFADSALVARASDGSSVTTFMEKDPAYVPGPGLISWNMPAMLVRATGAAGTDGVMSLSAWRNGRKTGDSGPIRIFTVPEIRAESPGRYLYAAMPGAAKTISFRQPEACAAYAKFLTDIGIRHLASENAGWNDGPNADVYKREFRRNGGRRITPCSDTVANGYYIGNHDDIPEGDRIVTAKENDSSWADYARHGICPLAVIEERAYFREKVLPVLEKRLRGCDGLRANWEPFMFNQNGCYCGKCRAKFAAFAGVPEGKLCADWPACVKLGSDLGTKWQKFRSLQSAEVVKTLNRHVMRMTGGADSFGLVPAITWREVNSTWREKRPAPESAAADYAASIPTLGTWGPYVMWDTAAPYVYAKRAPLVHFIGTKDMREQVDRDYPASCRPRLLGGTQGYQCGWVTQPEWLEMAMDSYFFNGFDGTQAYFFPEGLDARFCAGYARSASRAAKYERYVEEGKRDYAAVTLAPVAEYALPADYVSDYIPKYRDVPMLQCVSYRCGAAMIAVVFNFWERGEAFFTLKAPGLPQGRCRVVDEDGLEYAASDLQAGLRLVVPAARTKVFEIVPEGAETTVAVRRRISADDLKARFEERRPALAAAAAEDRRLQGSQSVRTVDTAAEL